jgi:nitrite reductase/ring-hydroxylating ferredoxin subunit
MDSYMDQYRTGPETLGGRYMRLFWHPVYRSQDLKPGWAKPIKIMSENFTLYRGEGGKAHVVAFQCAHRGLQLSVGWVEDDCIGMTHKTFVIRDRQRRCFFSNNYGSCYKRKELGKKFFAIVDLRSG